ncbi:large conductance mechanosensitive channel protein MscL [Lacisediminihabitans changchengi]|uniref:Large-conductance mechanosensitive channel n=1 Tax=Lacisediminihabitans changchengi TaxID=2787634 RepID=A0A934VXP2_9MICO|nr:large conductance mechanosensitive channel protein MscL [Lacisediminihabitans changchengi]MBK4347147.1 large conductance mechanosensitive channel protein MscL [Lacisediminihabitans changchengi]
MLKGFKDFILRGNVIDLAVAVVIGAAFTAIVNTLVTAVFNPIIGALFNANDLKDALKVTIPTVSGGSATILFGAVIAAVIQFIIVAAVVYFALVLPINRLSKIAYAKLKKEEDATPADVPPTETELLIQIRDLLAGVPSPEGDHTLPSTAAGAQPSSGGRHAE